MQGQLKGTVLVTGGAGYVGSHVVVELLNRGFTVVLLDDFSNSHPRVVRRINAVARHGAAVAAHGDVRDTRLLIRLFSEHRIDAVVHLAGLNVVAQSMAQPELYYDVNICGTARLLSVMAQHGVGRLVFSSSATVYGETAGAPVTEDNPLCPVHPYGRTKQVIETLLADAATARPEWQIIALRYFNPVGAHASGLIGEDSADAADRLFALMARTADRRRSRVEVFGTDYPTPDGTCVRDFVHVVDVAQGHAVAVEAMLEGSVARGAVLPINLGTGRGTSVLTAIAAFAAVSGNAVPHTSAPRRRGDVAVRVADPSRARTCLGWRATHDLDAMCRDEWNWQVRNPHGYRGIPTAAGEVAPPVAAGGVE